MPELPEVETTVKGLRRKIKGKEIVDTWTDWPKYFKKSPLKLSEASFRNCVVGKKISGVERVGKNILIHTSDNNTILIHQKLSGHLLFGKWTKASALSKKEAQELPEKWKNQKQTPNEPKKSFLWDEKNRFVRFVFYFKDGSQMAFSDLRRFGKIICGIKNDVESLPEIKSLGPDMLSPKLDLEKFEKLFKGKKTKIKPLLLNQRFVAGIGNIYADEILWRAKIHPEKPANKLDDHDIKKIYNASKKILQRAIDLGGTSTDDYREPGGEKGGFEKELKAYQRTGKPCRKCKTPIKRVVVAGRGTHLCPSCQRKK